MVVAVVTVSVPRVLEAEEDGTVLPGLSAENNDGASLGDVKARDSSRHL